jgi:phosphoglycolate phosphatase-like HAD superfamily hydrolase
MSGLASYAEPPVPAFLFDLDGTLIDSVYQHVIAWQQALAQADIDLSVWRIHRRIGMSGGLFVSALMRETGITLSQSDVESLQQAHAREYLKRADTVRPLPGAAELLAALTDRGVRWAIATSRPQPNLSSRAIRAGQCPAKRRPRGPKGIKAMCRTVAP